MEIPWGRQSRMYSRFAAAVRFSAPLLKTRFPEPAGQPGALTPRSWLRILAIDRQPGRLRPKHRFHTSEPRRGSAGARDHAAWRARKGSLRQRSCATCRLNAMLCERCLAMAFTFRKPSTACQITDFNLSGYGAHSDTRPCDVRFTPESGHWLSVLEC